MYFMLRDLNQKANDDEGEDAVVTDDEAQDAAVGGDKGHDAVVKDDAAQDAVVTVFQARRASIDDLRRDVELPKDDQHAECSRSGSSDSSARGKEGKELVEEQADADCDD